VPNAAILGVVVDPNSPDTALEISELSAAASTLGKQIKTFNVSNEGEISAAFAAIGRAAGCGRHGDLITHIPSATAKIH
jgi:hypothetical protein